MFNSIINQVTQIGSNSSYLEQGIMAFFKAQLVLVIVIVVVSIIIRIWLGYLLQTVANEKGYKGIGVLVLFVLFPMFTLLYTIALPDRGNPAEDPT